jgi:N-acyl homoserine lactone hydrolase
MEMKLHVFELGTMQMDANLVAAMQFIATAENPTKPNAMATFPVPAFLIESDYGFVLYDTGCHPEAMGPNGRWPQEFQNMVPWKGDETTTVMYKLKELGLSPKDIKTIIISHMHNDHAGCVEFFPDAQFIVAQDEFDAALRCYATHNYMASYIWKDIDTWSRKKLDWNLIERDEGDIELFKGLTIINLGPGHARGVLALKIDLKNTGTVILTSDAVYCGINYYQMREPGVIFDTIGWRRSTKRLKHIAAQNNAKVWFGHDGEQFATLKKSPEAYYD